MLTYRGTDDQKKSEEGCKMKKTKILVSICVATTIGIGTLISVYKINENNKKDIVQVKNNTDNLENDKDENIDKEQKQEESIDEKNEVINEEEKTINKNSDNNIDNNVVINDIEDNESNEVKDEIKGTQSNEVKDENKDKIKDTQSNETKEHSSTVNKEIEDKVIYDDSFLDIIDKGQINEEVKVPEQSIKPNYNQSDSYILEIEEAIFTRVNLERTANGLQPLNYNNTMQNYARIKSKDMGDRGYFAHENPEGELITAQMKRDGINYSAWGENIAYIQGNYSNASLATQFMDNWMNSQGHRENILSPNFKSIGIGVYKIGNTYYATQEFYR